MKKYGLEFVFIRSSKNKTIFYTSKANRDDTFRYYLKNGEPGKDLKTLRKVKIVYE